MTTKVNAKVVIAAALVIIGVSIAIGVAVVLFTGSSEPAPGITIEGVLIGESVSIEIPAQEAATVTHESGARIEIPAGATTEPTTVSVAEVEPPESDLEVRRAFDFSVGDVELLQPVTIHVPFELETGEDTAAIHALHWNEEAIGWEPVAGTVDESTRTIAVTTSDLSLFSWAWVKVDADCDVTPDTVEVGESFTVTATGSSLTSGNIKIYMKMDIKGPVDLPESKSEIAIVSMGEQFKLKVESALEIPAEHQIHCRIFWETIGPDVELKSREPLTALLDVEGEGQFMYRVDLALKAYDKLQFPIFVGEGFGIGLEVENLGDEPSIPFDLVAYFTSAVDATVTRVNSIEFGHSQEAAVRAGDGHLLGFEGLTPDDFPPGDYVVCVEIEYTGSSARDSDTSNDRACLDKYVLHRVEGAIPIYTTLTETKAGHRTWSGVPITSGLEPDAGLGFADDSGIRDDENLKKLYKRLAAELAFRKALQPERGEQHVLLRGLMENVKGPAEVVGYINEFCGGLEIGCQTAMENTGLLDSGLMDKFPHASHEAIGFAGQSIGGVSLFGDVYYSMLVNQALDMQQAFDTLDELSLLPLGSVWKEAVEEARVEVAIMDSNRWNAQALEIVNSKDEIGKFALSATVGGLTKYAVKKQLLHHLGITAQKALAHSLGLKIAGGTAATTGVGGVAAAAGPVLFVASVWFAAEVYSDVQENQDQIGVATLASFLNAAFGDPSYSPELREALAYAKYVAYDDFYKSDEGFLQEIASWITFRPGDHDLFLAYTDVERDKALEEVKALVSVASVEVSPESLTLAVGDTQILRGEATTVSGRVANSQDFDWSSSAPGIATVSEGGLVSGVAPGEATITFGVSNIRDIARVTVGIGTELPVEPPPPSVSDLEALVALYHATDGSGWNNNSNGFEVWDVRNPDPDIGSWHGVTVNDAGRVTELYPSSNGLRNSLPPELVNLAFLEWLDLSSNDLRGQISEALGNLRNLVDLDLSDNSLSGNIPASLGSLTNLEALYLSDNDLSGEIPVGLGYLPRMDVVYLGGNDLSGCIPAEWRRVQGDLDELGLPYCDVALNDLTINPGRLSPEFEVSESRYTAEVPAYETTITPANYQGASFQFLDAGGNVLTDADAARPGHQVQVTAATTTVTILVTSRDGREDGSYTIGIARSPGAPGAPVMNPATPGPSTLAISWSAPSDTGTSAISSYSLRYRVARSSGGASAPWTVIQSVWNPSLGSLNHDLTGLQPSVRYELQMRAVNSSGIGPWSAATTGTTVSALPPGVPLNLTATTRGQAEIRLSWGRPSSDGGSPITGYRIQSSQDGSTWAALVPNARPGSLTYSHTALSAGSTWHYRVASINSEGLGPWSNVATARTVSPVTPKVPGPPVNPAATPEGTESISLTWRPPTSNGSGAISGYQLEVSEDGVRWSPLDAVGPLTTSYTHTGLSPQSARRYRVAAVNPVGLGEWSVVFSATTDPVTTLPVEPPVSGSPEGDRIALAAFYHATGGRDWERNDNWLTNAPLGEWYRVTTDSEGRVTQLYLTGNQLSGEIPPELGSLSNLQRLYLASNELSGEIPAELGSLSNLRYLLLVNNALSGEIPPELGSLSNLKWLLLGDNQLSGEIPPELGSLSNLKRLYLRGNALSGEIPPELGSLSNLTHLDLRGNALSGEIPAELGSLSNLTRLDLHYNGLSGEIPAELGSLSNLLVLDLHDNGLSGEIPAELGSLSNLKRLYLAGNELSGEIPAELGSLSNLVELDLNGNDLSGCVPSSLEDDLLLFDFSNLGDLPFC